MAKIWISLLAAIAIATTATPLVFASTTYAQTYVGASPGVVGLTSTAPSLLIAGSQFGGVRFTKDNFAPLSVMAEDLSGSSVFLVVCQDLDADVRCGEAADGVTQLVAEPRVTGCGGVTLPATFRADNDTIAFVYSTSLPGTTCLGTATTGSILLTTAK